MEKCKKFFKPAFPPSVVYIPYVFPLAGVCVFANHYQTLNWCAPAIFLEHQISFRLLEPNSTEGYSQKSGDSIAFSTKLGHFTPIYLPLALIIRKEPMNIGTILASPLINVSLLMKSSKRCISTRIFVSFMGITTMP